MPFDTLIALFVFAFVASITPGPNNVMLLASGANFGFRRTLPHMFGIEIGFVSLIAAVGLGLGALLTAMPMLDTALKIAGALYLVYIAWRIATTRSMASATGASRPLNVLQAAAFQWINPKGWVMAVSAVAIYSRPDALAQSILAVIACFALSGLIATPTWTGFGTALSAYLDDPDRLKWFNIAMGVLLVLSLAALVI